MKITSIVLILCSNVLIGQTLLGNKFLDYINTHSIDDEGNSIAVINKIPTTSQNVEVFDYINNQWQPRPSNDEFIGFQIQLSGDGNTLIIGSSVLFLPEKVSIYHWDGSTWTQRENAFTSGTINTSFSDRVYINNDGTRIFFTDITQGEYRNYHWDGNAWILINTFNNLGINNEISINSDGTRLAYTENNSSNGSIANYDIKVLELDANNNWSQIGNDINNPLQLFSSNIPVNLAFNSDGNRLAIASPASFEFNTNAGAFAVYEYLNDQWNQIGNIVTGENANDFLGSDLAINADGNKVIVGIPNSNAFDQDSGESKLFELDVMQDTWNEILAVNGELSGSQDGSVVDINGTGDIISVGGDAILPQVRVFGVSTLSIDETNLLRFKMYPNPSNGEIFIELNQQSQLEIYDIHGRIVNKKQNLYLGKNKVKLQGLSNGLYFMRLSNVNGQTVQKLQLSR